MYDETQLKIIDATMSLIIDKGYSGATTKTIAKDAGVNESTIFRRFDGKKEIVLAAMELPKWNPGLKESDFVYEGDLKKDLTSFARTYMKKVTPQMVKISIGLRAADCDKMPDCDVESLSLQFIAMNFGFVFLDSSFGNKLIGVSKEDYIKNSIDNFVNGIIRNL